MSHRVTFRRGQGVQRSSLNGEKDEEVGRGAETSPEGVWKE